MYLIHLQQVWLMCQKMEFAARLTSCEVERSKVHETFMRIDMKHSNFSLFVCHHVFPLLKL